MLSRLVINFSSKEQAFFNFMAAVTICSDLGAPPKQSVTVYIISPSICHEVMEPDAIILVFWMLNFMPTFSHSFFIFIKRLFSSSLSATRVYHQHIWGYWHFSRQFWFQLPLHPAKHFPWYTAYKLNKQGDNIQPWCTLFPIWNQCVVPCPILTVASWPSYRFVRK